MTNTQGQSDTTDEDGAETPQQWRNQLLRELADAVHDMAPPDAQRRIERIMRKLATAERCGDHERQGGETL